MTEKPTYKELELKVRALEKEAARRERTDEALRLEESRLEALLKLNEMTGAPLQEITDFALEEAVRLTGSEIGYLAFMNEDETCSPCIPGRRTPWCNVLLLTNL